jgi:O-antigen chain-terminating methyltransferase
VDGDDRKTEELSAIIREIQERVRARYPQAAAGTFTVPLPDLMPVVHARDIAGAKVAAIGTVNPRAPGPLNALIQRVKRVVARLLEWHVREQVEFNRGVMHSIEAILEAFSENNRALNALAAELSGPVTQRAADLKREAEELKDVRVHWTQWRLEWERKLASNEVQFLRSVADLQAAFQQRASLMESNFRELVRGQHSEFEGALERSGLEIQKRLWADLEKIRLEYERLIHTELRVVRQRAAAMPPAPVTAAPQAAAPAAPEIDWLRFADRFRGTEEYVQEKQRLYVPHFQGCGNVLDLGCGRGEFLGLMKEAGIPARGVDLDQESVALCRAKGLEAETADLFRYLAGLPDGALDGIFCAQVIEHLPPERLPEMLRLTSAKLMRGGRLVIETPNPESLAIFTTHFYLDPTHQRPVPPQLLVFYLEEFGMGQIRVERLSPPVESLPALATLPEDFRNVFFGSLDYAVFGQKL